MNAKSEARLPCRTSRLRVLKTFVLLVASMLPIPNPYADPISFAC